MADTTQQNRNIRVATPLGPDVLLFHRMTGRDGMSELGEYELELLGDKADVAIDDVLGQRLTIDVDAGNGTVRQLNGIVTRFVLTGRAGRYATYRATVRPWLWLLTRTADCRIFQEQDVVAILRAIFEKYALADYDLAGLSGSFAPMPYCVQYRETDFVFASRLMERFGIYYFFRHAGGRHTLVLADSPAAHARIAGPASLQYFPDPQAAARARESVHDWQAGGEILSDQYMLRAFNFETPAVDLTARSTVAPAYLAGVRKLELYDYPGAYDKRDAGDGLVKTRLQSVQAGSRMADGGSAFAGIAPGAWFTLAGHPQADQNGDMLVVAASYRLYSDRFEAELGKPDLPGETPKQFDCRFSAIPRNAAFRPAQRTPVPVVRGPQTAIVVGKAGEEIWTDKYGRVKVQFHWDRLGADDEKSSCWVRVAQGWAGKRYGQLFIPRIGHEVVVSFLEGDPDQPLVTGAVYNAANLPPVALPDEATRSTVKTNTSKGGGGFNEIRFEDRKDAEELFIQAEKDCNRVVKNNDTLKVGFARKDPGDQTIEICNDQRTDIGNDRTLHVANNDTVKVDADQKVNAGKTIVIEAGTSIELVVGGSSVKIEPTKITMKSAQVAIEASGTLSVKAGGVLTVEGALVKIN